MGITVTPTEKAELKAAGSLVRPLAGADGAASTYFHNPKTGQEFVNLPIDPYHLGRHLQRGLVMGPAPAELKAKWEAGEAERSAANDALMAEHLSKSPVEETPQFREAVAAAVIQVLEKLGIELPSVPTDAPSESETKLVVSQASQPELHLVE